VDLQGSVQKMVSPSFQMLTHVVSRERGGVGKCQRRNYATSACLKVMGPKVMMDLRGY